MYCNSCMRQIPKENVTYCAQCNVPLCKTCANHCLDCGKELCDSCYAENNFRCEECYTPEHSFKKIRRSHIEQYAGCPYSLYLQLIQGITPPMGSYAQLGVIVHELIDQISHGLLTTYEAKAILEEKVMDWNMSVKEEDAEYSVIPFELIDVGMVCLDNFNLIKDMFETDFLSEHNIQYEIAENLPKVSCTLDRIDTDKKGNLHIHDWKTGKPKSGKALIEDLQPPLYIYAVYMETGKMPETFTLHYLKPNKHITYRKIDDMKYEVKTTRSTYILDVNDALKRTKKILKGIQDGKFSMPDERTHAWRCNSMCWFGMSGKCKGVTNETWKNLNEKYSESA